MNRKTIGGALDYARLANLNRPKDPARVASEIHRLHGEGLTALDIAGALRMRLDAVIGVLGVPPQRMVHA